TATPAQLTDGEAQREVEAAALLTPIAYVRQRAGFAKRIGVPVGQLDKMVRDYRNVATGGDGEPPFDEVEACPEPVDGEKLLDDVTAVVRQFVAVDRDLALLCAPWVVLTYLADHATILPIIAITSPEKGCGKTTLLALIGKLANRPILASNITGPALFRGIEK